MDFLLKIVRETVFFYNEIAIYLLFGFTIAGLLHVLFPESFVRRQLGRSSLGSVVKATLFGIPLPLCSCSVVPVATSLHKSGASKGSVVSFLITTPQIGADSFLVTYSLIGWIFAVFRVLASAITAFVAGIIINLFDHRDGITDRRQGAVDLPDEPWQVRLRNVFGYVEYELLGSIVNALLAGILIAGIITAMIPDGFFERYLGSDFLSMLLMLAVGIPLYVCASASTPIAASLLLKGMSPGAALVFLLTGPATNAANLSAIVKIVGKRSTTIYLLTISLVSLALGFLLNLTAGQIGIDKIVGHHHHEMLPAWLRLFGSFTMGAMIVWFYLHKKLIKRSAMVMTEKANRMKLEVKGMTCQHCVATVKKAVEAVPGALNVVVNLDQNNVEFELQDERALEQIKQNIQAAGYEV